MQDSDVTEVQVLVLSMSKQWGQDKGHSYMNALTVLRSRVEQVAKQFQGLLLRKPKRGSTQTQVLALTFFKLLQHIKHLIILLIFFFHYFLV